MRPAEQPQPVHCIHPRSWCQLSGGVCEGRHGVVQGWAGWGGVEGTPAALTERTSVLECAFGGIDGGSGS